jgi:acetate kinase
LLSQTSLDEIDGIVFSGGIGEKASILRADVLRNFSWLGAEVGQDSEGVVSCITTESSKLKGWVVETDEEGWCAHLAREDFKI